MLFTLGQRTQTGDVVDLLLACHHRIREHLALARRLANASTETQHDSIRAAAARVRAYFGVAFPLHRDDEEIDIFPRLRGRSAGLDAALAALEHDHEEQEMTVSGVLAICEQLEREPSRLGELAGDLANLARVLDTALEAHTKLEEAIVFPAILLMTSAEREDLRARMQKRRGA